MEKAGFVRFAPEPATTAWVGAALPRAIAALAANSDDLRCGGTWNVGLDLLPNGPDGAVAGVALGGDAITAARQQFGELPLHRAQLSTVLPGYPQPWPDESPTAFAYRRNRDAAHVDGLLPVGPDKRRMIREPHAFVLGIALNDCDPGASPLVVWPGSHRIMGAAFRAAVAMAARGTPLRDVDVTAAYQEARRKVFETCPRLELPARPGEAILMHRHLLHGVAPWAEGASAPPEGRIIAYFRPQFSSVQDWLAP